MSSNCFCDTNVWNSSITWIPLLQPHWFFSRLLLSRHGMVRGLRSAAPKITLKPPLDSTVCTLVGCVIMHLFGALNGEVEDGVELKNLSCGETFFLMAEKVLIRSLDWGKWIFIHHSILNLIPWIPKRRTKFWCPTFIYWKKDVNTYQLGLTQVAGKSSFLVD